MKHTTNFIKRTDSYKPSHFLMYPPKTTGLFAYLESRVGSTYDLTVWFGLQYILQQYFTTQVTKEMVLEAAEFYKAHGTPFPLEGWMRVVEKHNGYIPIRIKALPEGSVVPISTPLMTVESTDPELYWMVTWMETQLMRVWYPVTVATRSWWCKKIILGYLLATGTPVEEAKQKVNFMLHDFGARGVSSGESAGIGGMAHLVNFMGSDTDEGVDFANFFYHHPMAAFSLPASEHSTIIAWGREHEEDAYRNILDKFAMPGALVANVSDSYDLYNAVENIIGGSLRQQIIDSGVIFITRPDSGYPPEVCVKVLSLLDSKFGSTLTSTGHKLLNKVRVIQGDGNDDHESIVRVLTAVADAGYAAENMAFGMGGGLLQKLDRDTQRFAYKISEATVDGVRRPVSKDPATDHTKKSKAGRVDVFVNDLGEYVTINADTYDAPYTSALVTVYEDGVLATDVTLDEVRVRANAALYKEFPQLNR